MAGGHPSVHGSTATFELPIRQFRLHGKFTATVEEYDYAVARKR